ncbi:pectate lyase family protein [Fulvivirga sediminis]|uniref:Pectate lyase n=1 Tax=Fulvivirga sediminis TaxID=2803949 RepID=A0A937F8R9_9BACT|nr:pectate lyase [Fulvivirga sediminis]MBL3656113.1 pectate lyase [Fulvivirga sediminis]
MTLNFLTIHVLLLSLLFFKSDKDSGDEYDHALAESASGRKVASGGTLAFPGADGFGKYATGGRGGKVLVVSNLNDQGEGSLREAIKSKGPRIIIFSVSGTIELESELPIDNGNITIAGQSAPGQGICIKNYPIRVSSDNVIVRYMRFRLGTDKKIEEDAFNGRRHKNIIIDHCSMSWSTDECASFYGNADFTMQWCIISESLNNSVHHKGDHGYGGIWGGKGASFHHNLLAHHSSRNPRFSGSATTPNTTDEVVDFRNNVIYNWGHNSAYGGEKGKYNMVNNYYKPGPATKKSIMDRIINPSEPYGKFFVKGNVIINNEKVSADNWNGGVQCDDPTAAKANEPFDTMPLKYEETAEEAFSSVLKYAGASLKRDGVDERIVKEVRTGTATYGNGIIDTPQQVGGWPVLLAEEAPIDSDNDGIPDAWEMVHKLNPEDSSDAAIFSLNKDYTNVEIYLNELVK